MKLFKFAILLPIFLTVFPASAWAQQWSSDPWIDALKQSMANEIKDPEVIDYCEQDANRQKDMCEGVNDHQKTTFVPYDQALKVGQEKLAQIKANQNVVPPLSGLAAYAAREKRVEEAVTAYCLKNTDPKSQVACKNKPVLVRGVMQQLMEAKANAPTPKAPALSKPNQ